MSSTVPTRRQLRLSRPVVAASVAIAGLGVDLALDPTSTHIPLCPFKAVTGLQCPLCGGLRSAYSLVHLDLAAAARFNILFVIGLPVALLYWADWYRRDRAGLAERRLTRPVLVTICLIAVTFTVVRNLPALRGMLAVS